MAAAAIAAHTREHSKRLSDPAVDMRHDAQALIARGQLQAAEGLLRKAVEVSRDWHALYQDLAAIHHMQGEYEQSVEMYKAADHLARLDPVAVASTGAPVPGFERHGAGTLLV